MLAAKFAKAAARAEKLRLEALARRQAKRCVYALIGVVFAVAVLCLTHLAVELALVPTMGALQVTVLLIVFDLAVAFTLFAIAGRSRPGKIEAEAEYLKRRALTQMKEEFSTSALVPALGFFVGLKRLRRWFFVAEFALRFLGRKQPKYAHVE
jgi:hypothetical protein